MQDWLIQVAHTHQYIVYAIIVVLACVEGPILSMIFGVLIKFGYFSFWPVYIALMLGDLAGDTIWYQIGKNFGHRFIGRFGKYFSITEEKVGRVTDIFHRYKHSIIFISKITTGFGFAIVTLFTAGMVKIPFKRYIFMNFLGQFVWTGILLAIGYFFGQIYTQIDSLLSRLFLVALFILILFALNGYKKYLRSQVNKLNI